MVLPTYGRYLPAFLPKCSKYGTLFKIALTGIILTVFLFDPGPAFQSIPDPNPSVKLGQISVIENF
jgi:hypothetical protein